MNILVFSQASWNTSNAFGNTVTNWFDGWSDTHFFHFYARQQKPNTDIVEKYYHVSAIEIIKKTIKFQCSGRIIDSSDVVEKGTVKELNTEQEQIAKLHNSSNQIIYWGMEQIWLSKIWINKNFDAFVKEANPDIIFAFATSPFILEPAIKHIKVKKPSVKVVLWIADDILCGYNQSAWYRRGYLKKGINYCFSVADRIYGASVEMCQKYSKMCGKEVIPLYKGCSFERSVKEKKSAPLRLVYAGNLLYGRFETLKKIISVLRIINSDECNAVLEVYSNTPINEKEKQQWFDNINAFNMSVRPYKEIKGILNESDVVLHVESFEKEQIETVKYSFSTKIIDCLESGSCVMAIGPKGLASIDYFNMVDGAIVINEISQIEEVFLKLVYEEDTLSRARRTRSFALHHHEIGLARKNLRADFERLL